MADALTSVAASLWYLVIMSKLCLSDIDRNSPNKYDVFHKSRIVFC
jgi:hypothetical protein